MTSDNIEGIYILNLGPMCKGDEVNIQETYSMGTNAHMIHLFHTYI